jgi:uncharacterized protein (TIGR02246 family)
MTVNALTVTAKELGFSPINHQHKPIAPPYRAMLVPASVFALTFVISGLTGCEAAAKSPGLTDADKAQITAHREAFVKAVRSNDAAAMAATFSDDAMYLAGDQKEVIRGRQAIEKLFRGQQPSEPLDYSVTPLEINGTGDLAYEVGMFTIKWTPEGATKSSVATGKHVWILKKQSDGSWKSAVDISQPPPGN